MRLRSVLAMAFLVLSSGCEKDAGATQAIAALEAFQAALLRGDEAACSELVTVESRAAMAGMPWQQVRDKQSLVVLGAEGAGAEFRVHVRDPNNGGLQAEFVVVREYGNFVVDLVATAGLTAEVKEASGAREEFTPRELTPVDMERIRQHELAQPPR